MEQQQWLCRVAAFHTETAPDNVAATPVQRKNRVSPAGNFWMPLNLLTHMGENDEQCNFQCKTRRKVEWMVTHWPTARGKIRLIIFIVKRSPMGILLAYWPLNFSRSYLVTLRSRGCSLGLKTAERFLTYHWPVDRCRSTPGSSLSRWCILLHFHGARSVVMIARSGEMLWCFGKHGVMPKRTKAVFISSPGYPCRGHGFGQRVDGPAFCALSVFTHFCMVDEVNLWGPAQTLSHFTFCCVHPSSSIKEPSFLPSSKACLISVKRRYLEEMGKWGDDNAVVTVWILTDGLRLTPGQPREN